MQGRYVRCGAHPVRHRNSHRGPGGSDVSTTYHPAGRHRPAWTAHPSGQCAGLLGHQAAAGQACRAGDIDRSIYREWLRIHP
ncbi:hypothetical protein GCM10010109_47320 [Actinoplanes campanulatus]|nr:hypothetical protein GCM10010109_47320 [Actinoplanes campanulatus]GID38992.1 hypothetical protein Aca09nite_54980 [Actinoplanes campanulatus]